MLTEILNSDLTATLMLELYRRDTVYASGLARELNLTLSAVQKQLARFERVGILISQQVGKTKTFSFNRQNSYVEPLMAMLKLANANSKSNQQPQNEVDSELWRY